MSSAPPLSESLAAALDALRAALARAEQAVAKRKGGMNRAADAEEELAAMQDDRSRLSQELAAAIEASRALRSAHQEAERRVAAAAAWVERALGEAGAE